MNARSRALGPLALLAALAALAALATTAAAQTPPPASGDWIIGDQTSLTALPVEVAGNVRVVSGGTLTLSNVDLTLNSSYPGEFLFVVESGGTLTMTGGSIVPANLTNGYRFELNGTATIDGATLGYMWGSDTQNLFGVQIYSSTVSISNSTIEGGYRGNVLVGANAQPTLRFNTIRYARFATTFVGYTSCQISLQLEAFGLAVVGGGGPRLQGNRFQLNGVQDDSSPWIPSFELSYQNVTCSPAFAINEHFDGIGLAMLGGSIDSDSDTYTLNPQVSRVGGTFTFTYNGTALRVTRDFQDVSGNLRKSSGVFLGTGTGNFTASVVDNNQGYGMYGMGGTFNVRQSVVSNHTAPLSGATVNGGGIYNQGSALELEDVQFFGNVYAFVTRNAATTRLNRPSFSLGTGAPIAVLSTTNGAVVLVENASFDGLAVAVFCETGGRANATFYNTSVTTSQIQGSFSRLWAYVMYTVTAHAAWVNDAPLPNGTVLISKGGVGNLRTLPLGPDGWSQPTPLEAVYLQYLSGSTPTILTNLNLNATGLGNGSTSDPTPFSFTWNVVVHVRMNDTAAPLLSVLSPAPDSTVGSHYLTVEGVAADFGSGIYRVEVTADGGNSTFVAEGPLDHFKVPIYLQDGLFDLAVTAYDWSGIAALVVVPNVTVDTTVPALSITSPAFSGPPPWVLYTNLSALLFEGRVDEDAALTLNGVVVDHSAGPFSEQRFLVEGFNVFHFSAVDRAGNTKSLEVTVIYDSVAPWVVVDTPRDGLSTARATITLSGHTDTGCTVWVAGAEVPNLDGAFSAQVNLTEGRNVIAVRARDLAGNERSVSVDVTYEPGNPPLTLEKPEDGLLTSAGSVVVSGQTSAAIDHVVVNGLFVATSGGGFAVELQLFEGANTITVRAEGDSGNVAEVRVTVSRDSVPPVLVITSPVNGSIFDTTSTRLKGTAEGALRVTVNGRLVPLDGSAFDSDQPLDEGVHALVVVAVDQIGNFATLIITVERDTAPPTLTITIPAATLLVHDEYYEVRGTASGAARVLVNGEPAGLSANGTFAATIRLPVGSTSVHIQAFDAAGNEVSVDRTLYRPAPDPPAETGLFGMGSASYGLLPAAFAAGFAALLLLQRRMKRGRKGSSDEPKEPRQGGGA